MKKYVILVLCLLLMTGCGKKTKEELKDDTSLVEIKETGVIGEQTVSGILFKNASLTIVNGGTSFYVTLENTVTTVKRISHLKIRFQDEEGLDIQTINRYEFPSMKKGDTEVVSTTLDLDLSEVKKITYEVELR